MSNFLLKFSWNQNLAIRIADFEGIWAKRAAAKFADELLSGDGLYKSECSKDKLDLHGRIVRVKKSTISGQARSVAQPKVLVPTALSRRNW